MSDGEYGPKCDFCGIEYDEMGNDLAQKIWPRDPLDPEKKKILDWCGQCLLKGQYVYTAEMLVADLQALMREYYRYIFETPKRETAAHLRVLWMENYRRRFESANGMGDEWKVRDSERRG